MFRSLRLGGAALAAGVCLALPAAAGAATVITLTGETLQSSLATSSGTVNCATSPTGTSTMTYDVTGVAAGPYPGTFHETGTVTFHQDVIESFSAHFTIDSPNGTVVGDKTMDPAELTPITQCGPLGSIPAFGRVLFAERYTATVTGSPTGDFTESGRSTMNLTVQESGPGDTAVIMAQDFQSGGPPGTTITLTPVTSINPVGTDHTVTATVRDAVGEPVQGMTVLFTLTPGGGSICRGTDANGVCTLTYRGPDFPQADEITACADTNVNSESDPTEPCAVASKVWTAPATTTGQVRGGGYIKDSSLSFAVGADAATITDPVTGHCNANDHVAHIKIKCLDITTMILAPTHATLFGTAEQDGVATNYRIDVDDLSDAGLPDTFTITTDLGYTNGGPLTGGNIQIRP